LSIPDGRRHLVVYGIADAISADPERAALTAAVFGKLSDSEPPDPDSIVGFLDEQQRTVLRVTPDTALFHE